MLAKTPKAKTTGDYRPIANLRLLHKMSSYMILQRIEPVLDAAQPESQLGLRAHRRIDEHLLTASKSKASNMPIWILSMDLSKAFDRVDWQSLWHALRAQGVSEQIVWILQCMYFYQRGEVVTCNEHSKRFEIRAGVRQGCVLSPRFFLQL